MIAAFGPIGPFMVLGAFGSLLIILSLPALVHRAPDPLDRLRQGGGARAFRKSGDDKAAPAKLRYDSGISSLDKLAPYLEPQNQKEFSASKLKLVQAGYRGRTAVSTFNFTRMVLGISLMLMGLASVFIRTDEPGTVMIIMSVLIPAAVGYYLPAYWVERRRQTRQEEIVHGFPDALDLMLVCVEAGQSLDQAIQRVGVETRVGYPTLGQEFEIVSNEMRAGKDRVTVLRDMSERCGVTDISSFVTVLIQSATFGTSIADALRIYASEMRDKRVMRAEEKANTLPTKMTVGTMLFTVPPLLVILVGPSIYDIYVNLLSGGN